jgi:hypothetical protein
MCFIKHHNRVLCKIRRYQRCNLGINDIVVAEHHDVGMCQHVSSKKIRTPVGVRNPDQYMPSKRYHQSQPSSLYRVTVVGSCTNSCHVQVGAGHRVNRRHEAWYPDQFDRILQRNRKSRYQVLHELLFEPMRLFDRDMPSQPSIRLVWYLPAHSTTTTRTTATTQYIDTDIRIPQM